MIRSAVRLKIAAALLPVVLVAMLLFGLIMGAASFLGVGGNSTAGCASSLSATTGRILWPLKAGSFTLSSPYGPRAGGFHHGQDFAAPIGTPIYAVADGVIEKAGTASGFGDWIVEKSTIGGQVIGFVYGHEFPSGLIAQEGLVVKAGDLIGLTGNNGQSTGPHMHFEVWIGGRFGGHDVDPMGWLTGNASTTSGSSSSAPATAPNGGLTKATPSSGPTGLGPASPSTAPATGGNITLVGLQPVQGQQATMSIDSTQRDNVAKIVGVVKGRKLPLRVAVLAVATTMQESGIRALTYGDRDSLGMYQQRGTWGSAAVREDPVASTGLFLDRLVAFDWASLPLAEAVQRVQVSATPTAYARWEQQAEALVAQAAGVDPITAGLGTACTVT